MPDVITVHQSDASTFKKCRQLWDFSSNIRGNLEPISNSPNAFWFGTGYHLAMYYFYTRGQSWEAANNAWKSYCDAAPFDIDDETYALGAGMIHYYTRVWAPKNETFEFVAAEEETKIPLYFLTCPVGKYPKGTRIDYGYRLDGDFLDKRTGLYYIREYKTSASIASNYEWLTMDDQCGKYLAAQRRKYPERRYAGVDYIIARKAVPAHLNTLKSGLFSTDKRQLTTYDMALADYNEDWKANWPHIEWATYLDPYREFLDALKAKPDPFIYRQTVTRNMREVEASWAAMRWEIRDMVDDPKIYRTPSAMNCNNCAFFAPCLAKWEGSDFKTILRLEYKQRESYQAPEEVSA